MSVNLGINDLKELTSLLSEKTGYPFHEFSLSFMKRRLNVFFDKLFIKSKERFIEQLNNDYFIMSLLYNIPVDTTELFRDPGFWRTLNSKVICNHDWSDKNVWFPDVSSGEELFSFLIINQAFNKGVKPNTIFNHPSLARLEEIKTGIINARNAETNENNFKRLETDTNLDEYIGMHDNSFYVQEDLIAHTLAVKGWFLTPPKEQCSLIIFRNSMLYLTKNLQDKVGQVLYESLLPGGYLAIGIKEQLPDSIVDRMESIDEQERIFKKPGALIE